MNKTFDFKTIAGKAACNGYKKHDFANEWKVAIISVLVLRLVTVAVSGYSSYEFFVNLLLPMVKDVKAAKVFAILFISLIEGLTITFLSKGFKFFLRKEWIVSLSSFGAAAIIYTISFHASTNGLADRQAKKIDKTEMITALYVDRQKKIQTDLQNELDRLYAEIGTIKNSPAGWVGRKRSVLTEGQLKQIESYNIKIFEARKNANIELDKLESAKNSELKQNSTNVDGEGNKYWLFVCLVMILQVGCNGAIMLFYSKIYAENNHDDLLAEKMQSVKKNISLNFYDFAQGEIQNIYGNIMQSLAIQGFMKDNTLALPLPEAKEIPKDGPKEEPKPDKKVDRPIGFKIQTITPDSGQVNNLPTEKKQGKDIIQGVSLTKIVNDTSKLRICKHCSKEYTHKHHKQLYCCDTCRQLAWEQKTGYKLPYKK